MFIINKLQTLRNHSKRLNGIVPFYIFEYMTWNGWSCLSSTDNEILNYIDEFVDENDKIYTKIKDYDRVKEEN